MLLRIQRRLLGIRRLLLGRVAWLGLHVLHLLGVPCRGRSIHGLRRGVLTIPLPRVHGGARRGLGGGVGVVADRHGGVGLVWQGH